MPPAPRQARRSALAPFPLVHPFLFGGGIFLKIEWAETELGRLPVKTGSWCHSLPFGASCSISSLVVVQRLKGGTLGIRLGLFPLGLRAPRCLGVSLFLANAPCEALARATHSLGRGRNPLPSASSARQGSPNRRHQPLSSFSSLIEWYRFRYGVL